jgi:hypothetical protein
MFDASTLKVEVKSSETSIGFQRTTRLYMPEDETLPLSLVGEPQIQCRKDFTAISGASSPSLVPH